MRTTLIILSILVLLTGCAASTNPYRFIFVEKQRKLYALNANKEECVQSGFEVIPKDPEVQKYNTVELWITFENCNMKEVIILDYKTRVMWGVPVQEKPKSKGSVGLQ